MKKIRLISTSFCLLFALKIQGQFFSKITNSPISIINSDSRSVNWIDINNDDWLDCFISNGPSGGQNNFLFINTGSGSFTLAASDSIVLDNKPSDGATFGDINNDGSIDAFVANWYNINNLFYTNNGNGSFTKSNSEIISNDLGYSETAAWGDYDGDGLLDLYVTNSAGQKKNYLYHNTGNGTFLKINSGDLVIDANYSRNVNWTDIDNDGDLDVFVTNENGQNENLYLNNGSGNFTKITSGTLLNDGGNTNSSSWADVDNDGDLDVFLANDQGFNSLFINEGNLVFTKILSDTVSTTPSRSFSSAWSDIDNDGDVDLFVTNSFGISNKLVNYLYINQGNGTFIRNSSDITASDSAFSYGCAFGDYNNDGFEDLAVATCRFGGIDQKNSLYQNVTNSNNWIAFKLIGTVSNASAIGAKIRVKAIINGNAVWQMREISSQSSYCGQNDLRPHFGIGDATKIDSVKIEWPSGIVDYLTQLTINQFKNVTESANSTDISDSKKDNESIVVFPNPTGKIIQIKSLKQTFFAGDEFVLFNSDGKHLLNETLLKNKTEINIDLTTLNLASGAYFVMLVRKNEKVVQKKILIN
ncbi:FG-GAP-like repeat-containing protein [Aurantibacillus circumpalustris]|uniref:FG-GAP-like repeat-containing protein n=1 Tax=Aurantibacillus circumpalustris TaxID=3036359 RepID=UPI00295BB1B7|nr:FG-GAP-like repeat-containing protein [Aurantibacillus circumpalustris]